MRRDGDGWLASLVRTFWPLRSFCSSWRTLPPVMSSVCVITLGMGLMGIRSTPMIVQDTGEYLDATCSLQQPHDTRHTHSPGTKQARDTCVHIIEGRVQDKHEGVHSALLTASCPPPPPNYSTHNCTRYSTRTLKQAQSHKATRD